MAETKQIQQLLEQNQNRMKTLQESFQSQLSEAINEITNALQALNRTEYEFQLADTRIGEHQQMIAHNEEQLAQLRETGIAMEAKIAGLYSKLSEHQQQIAVLQATLLETQGRIEAVSKELQTKNSTFETIQKQLAEKQQKLSQKKAEEDQELTRYKEKLTEAKEQIKRVKKTNPMADFLISEGLEPPELDILAILIFKKEVTISEIKRIVKTPPAITTRVLKEMENKGLLQITSSDKARLTINI